MTKPLKLALLIPLAATAFGLTALDASAAEDDFKTEAGFVSLYNGKDLTGWGYRDGDGKVTPLGVPVGKSPIGTGKLPVPPRIGPTRRMMTCAPLTRVG